MFNKCLTRNKKIGLVDTYKADFCDSVGIRTQDPQLRRLLLYPAELPNHPAYSAGKKKAAPANRTANIGIFYYLAMFFCGKFLLAAKSL